jgi:hypothetical protein
MHTPPIYGVLLFNFGPDFPRGEMKTLVAKGLCNVIHGVSTGHSSPGTLRYEKNKGTWE